MYRSYMLSQQTLLPQHMQQMLSTAVLWNLYSDELLHWSYIISEFKRKEKKKKNPLSLGYHIGTEQLERTAKWCECSWAIPLNLSAREKVLALILFIIIGAVICFYPKLHRSTEKNPILIHLGCSPDYLYADTSQQERILL